MNLIINNIMEEANLSNVISFSGIEFDSKLVEEYPILFSGREGQVDELVMHDVMNYTGVPRAVFFLTSEPGGGKSTFVSRSKFPCWDLDGYGFHVSKGGVLSSESLDKKMDELGIDMIYATNVESLFTAVNDVGFRVLVLAGISGNFDEVVKRFHNEGYRVKIFYMAQTFPIWHKAIQQRAARNEHYADILLEEVPDEASLFARMTMTVKSLPLKAEVLWNNMRLDDAIGDDDSGRVRSSDNFGMFSSTSGRLAASKELAHWICQVVENKFKDGVANPADPQIVYLSVKWDEQWANIDGSRPVIAIIDSGGGDMSKVSDLRNLIEECNRSEVALYLSFPEALYSASAIAYLVALNSNVTILSHPLYLWMHATGWLRSNYHLEGVVLSELDSFGAHEDVAELVLKSSFSVKWTRIDIYHADKNSIEL